jgi:hypothetical protein
MKTICDLLGNLRLKTTENFYTETEEQIKYADVQVGQTTKERLVTEQMEKS